MLLNIELFRQLSAYPGLAALVSTRIFPLVATEGCATPYVTYQRVTETPTYTHDNVNAIGNDLLQFDAYGLTSDSARAVAVQVKAALDAWSSPAVQRAFIQTDKDLYEPDTKLFRVSIDAEIWSGLTAP